MPKFTGDVMNFPEWKQKFEAIMATQELDDQITLIYLQMSIPKEYEHLLSGVKTMLEAWSRLENRFGDAQQRILAIYNNLVNVVLKGRDFEKIEALYFDVEHAVALMRSANRSISSARICIWWQCYLASSPRRVGKNGTCLRTATGSKW